MPETIDIYSPDIYVNGPPHDIFEELRKTNPIYYQEIPDQQGYYAVLRHKDCVTVSRDPYSYSSSEGGVVMEDMDEANLASMRNMLLGMDPPRHISWRNNVSPHFKQKVIAEMENQIRDITKGIFKTALDGEKSGDVDFVHDVCAFLPSNVMGELMDIPEDDREKIHHWSEMQTSGQDPEINPDAGSDDFSTASMEMFMYGMEHAARHRAKMALENGSENSSGSFTELCLSVEVDGKSMTDEDFGSFFLQLVTAGNDTTKTMLVSGTLALLDHPDQLEELRSDPSLIPSAVEEILRYENPLHYFRRTTKVDVELAGVPIKAGEKVVMVYTSANRDEAVFENPHTFDIHRSPNPHLSFGIGEHFCLGVHLARLEGKIFFEELLSTFPKIELIGEARRTRSNLNNAIKELPLKLTQA